MTTALLLRDGVAASALTRSTLADGYDERWLQKLVFERPEILPIDELDPGAGQIVPLCRELALPGATSLVYLDMLGVTPRGRLVLVECKLWRNPQARREVVAQILEYAALLRRWTFADLTAKLKAALGSPAQNPIFEAVRARVPAADEARLTDGVSRSLEQGAFDLLITGDGIRSDLAAIAAHLNDRAGLTSRLALVEMQIWHAGSGETLVVPHIPFRTQVVEHRVVVDQRGAPLPLAPALEPEEDPAATETARSRSARDPVSVAANRAFWQRFIDTVQFEHPEQAPARHGGDNWVRIPLPPPARWLTAYRLGVDRAGLFATFTDETGRVALDGLATQLESLRLETGLDVLVEIEREQPFKGSLAVRLWDQGDVSEEAILAWLRGAANRLVNALRPRLAALAQNG